MNVNELIQTLRDLDAGSLPVVIDVPEVTYVTNFSVEISEVDGKEVVVLEEL